VQPHPSPPADRRSVCVAALLLLAAAPVLAQGPSSLDSLLLIAQAQTPLRTFRLEKPLELLARDPASDVPATPPRAPNARESLRTMVGVGYVQGADWGTELLASGGVAGAQVQLNTLVTHGREGLMFDHGSVSVFHPDTRWRIEAGDVFSHLRGASSGGRVSWVAAGNRRPAIALYGPRRGMPDRGTVVSYRDQIQLRGQTLLDAEVATDKSYLVRNRFAVSRLEIETFYRSQRLPLPSRDGSVSGGLTLWRGLSVTGGLFQSVQPDDRSEWRMIAVRLPVARFLDLTFERAFAGTRATSQTTSAVMGSLAAGDLRLFHRQQYGEYDFLRSEFSGSVERQQTQSMTSYSPGPRLNLTLQLATQRTDTGQVQHWEELQTTLKVTSTTTLRTVTSVPDVRNRDRLQAYLRQELPMRFAIQADYGRVSAYQSIAHELDRSRFKLMLFKTVDIATPARGAEVAGRVLDDAGRGVAGARVKLGPYSADTDTAGRYLFKHVPRGEYELSLESHLLPADFAWDGRLMRVTVGSTRRMYADLRVTPLNAIHGRVYIDRNANARFDAGEAVAGAVVTVGHRLTATDHEGAYSLYNLWPDTYVIRLEGLPPGFEAGAAEQTVTLLDGAPVTGADFRVVSKVRPILWGTVSK
jgi:hypothetical protein